jgi:hypothetical protein
VERQNLTMRISGRRFTRLTDAFGKKVENHEHMLAIYLMYYNFCRVHQTLRVTPAIEAVLQPRFGRLKIWLAFLIGVRSYMDCAGKLIPLEGTKGKRAPFLHNRYRNLGKWRLFLDDTNP